MAKEAIYEKDSVIEFVYRCNGDPASAAPSIIIYDETKAPEGAPLTVGAGLTRIGTTRLFKGEFTPDAEGVWVLQGTDDHGGEVAKDYAVGLQGVQSMAAKITDIDTKADIILAANVTIEAIVASVETKVDINTAAIAVLDGKVDTIDGKLVIMDGKLDGIAVDAGGAHFA